MHSLLREAGRCAQQAASPRRPPSHDHRRVRWRGKTCARRRRVGADPAVPRHRRSFGRRHSQESARQNRCALGNQHQCREIRARTRLPTPACLQPEAHSLPQTGLGNSPWPRITGRMGSHRRLDADESVDGDIKGGALARPPRDERRLIMDQVPNEFRPAPAVNHSLTGPLRHTGPIRLLAAPDRTSGSPDGRAARFEPARGSARRFRRRSSAGRS